MKLISNSELRSALDLEGIDAIDHKAEIERLRGVFRHSIQFDGFNAEETCVPYALGLTGDRAYEAIRRAFPTIFAGKKFMNWMLDGKLREVSRAKVEDLVCYFSAKGFEHVGVLLREGRATSKWGIMPRYHHGLAETPDSYGDRVRFFARPSIDDARSLFRSYAHAAGLRDEEIERAADKFR